MSADAHPLPIRLVSERPSPRFLGLTVDERNARVLGRATRTNGNDRSRPNGRQPSAILTIPSGVAITPALVNALPSEPGIWHLMWHAERPPIVWHTANGTPGRPVRVALPHGTVLDVSTAAARRASAWRLLRASGKPTDGWLSRHVHRKISRLFSSVMLQLGLTANHATTLTFLVGLASAWLMAQTSRQTMIAGGLLFWFASIADGIDGEMARLTLSESLRGEQIDTAVDHATQLLAYGGVMVGWWRQGIGPIGWVVAIGVAIGLPATTLGLMHVVRRANGTSPPFFVDTKPIEYGVLDAARETGAPALRLASNVWVLFRREAFSLAFFLVSLATGRRGVYPSLLATGLLIVAATLFVYRGEVERAIRRRFSPTNGG